MLPKDGQQFKNVIVEGEKAFSVVTAAYTTLKDLGVTDIHNHLSIQSTFDKEVSLRFAAAEGPDNAQYEITIEQNEAIVLDDFNHDGLIEIKYTDSAPTAGYIKTRSW